MTFDNLEWLTKPPLVAGHVQTGTANLIRWRKGFKADKLEGFLWLRIWALDPCSAVKVEQAAQSFGFEWSHLIKGWRKQYASNEHTELVRETLCVSASVLNDEFCVMHYAITQPDPAVFKLLTC